MLGQAPLLSLLILLLPNTTLGHLVSLDSPPPPGLVSLDLGLQWQYVRVELVSGEVHAGQVIGVYNEEHFMWHPSPLSTIALFSCLDSTVSLGDFR